MTYKEFREEVKKQILSFFPQQFAGADVQIQEVYKINDVKRYALCISGMGNTATPRIYLEGFYRDYQNGIPMRDILSAIEEGYQRSYTRKEDVLSFSTLDFEEIRKGLYIGVVNKEHNQNYLINAVYKDVPGTDMAAYVRVQCSVGQDGEVGSFVADRQMLEAWNVSDRQLFEEALQNTEKILPTELKNMWELVGEYLPEEKRKELKDHLADAGDRESTKCKTLLPFEQYVLSNEIHHYGAAAILLPGVLQEIGEATQGNFFILPSSLHEVILIKDNGDMSADELQRMVMEINCTKVAPEELLSDEVYRYDYRRQELVIATNPEQTKELLAEMENYWEPDNMAAESEWEQGEEQ